LSDESKKGSGLPFSPPVMREGSNLPFTPPVMSAPVQSQKGNQGPKSPISNKKQLKNAKKNQKRPISVRGLITGLFILIITAVAVTAVISPDILNKVANGEVIVNTQTCKVVEINSSHFFDTSCGKFEWNAERQPGSPKKNLVEGETYTIKASGFRFGLGHMYPSVITYEKVATK
jgi:hypothetical protein